MTLDDLPPNWEALMTGIYQTGGTDVEVRIALAIPPARALDHDTFKGLQQRHPEFSEAVKYGHALAEAWMWQQARMGMSNPNFKTPLWIVMMRGRFAFKGADRDAAGGEEVKEPVQFYLPDNGRQKKVS